MTAPESPQPVDVPDDDQSHVPPLTTRVVIAEDEALIRLDLKEMLEEEGYSIVGEAGDGEEAVELAREHRPDLVILDVKMPKMDGISAAEKIAEESIAPVLMLTAFSQRDLVERARDAGVNSEEGGDDVKSSCPLCLGLHTCYNGRYNEL
ncbi:response regulator, partial [Streptomyces violaceoruber]